MFRYMIWAFRNAASLRLRSPNETRKEIRCKLAEQKMNVSVSQADSTRLDMEQRGLAGVVRASVHYYNSEEEIERFCDFVTHMI